MNRFISRVNGMDLAHDPFDIVDRGVIAAEVGR